jgi:hypothetical protein
MKVNKIILGALISISALSCRKSEVPVGVTAPEITSAKINQFPVLSAWNGLSNWNARQTGQETVNSGIITDAAISVDVLSNGIVLVYAKQQNHVNQLPFRSGQLSLSYSVMPGAISIVAEGNSSAIQGILLSYIILSGEQLASLEAKQFSRAGLLNLSYDEVAAIIVQ